MNQIEIKLQSWQPADKVIEQAMPDNLHDWLVEARAITPMLQALFSDWRLDVHCEKMASLLPEEMGFLSTSNPQAWVREIFHHGEGKNWIYAKLSVPNQTFELYQSQLESLGDKPIGATLLFNNPDVVRSGFSYRIIKTDDMDYQAACQALDEAQEFWARRSVFSWQNQPLLLTEIFNPHLPKPRL